jgi:hypothetical protein
LKLYEVVILLPNAFEIEAEVVSLQPSFATDVGLTIKSEQRKKYVDL